MTLPDLKLAIPPERLRRRPTRGRGGCLGCLPQLLGLAVFAVAVAEGVAWITNPWIFTVGGGRRWLPLWQGVGEAQGPGGRYRFYIEFSPSSVSSKLLPSTSIAGSGVLCTPKGERLSLHLSGGASGTVYNAMDGPSFGLQADRRPMFWTVTGSQPPRLTFNGRWAGDTLAMTDNGSFAAAFLPDGTVNPKPIAWTGPTGSGVPITFTERDWWWNPPCGR